MRNKSEAKCAYLLKALGIAAAAGILVAAFGRTSSRTAWVEGSDSGLDYLERAAEKVRAAGKVAFQQIKKHMSCQPADNPMRSTEAEKQTYQEARREHLGG